jgi:hypothetical protein
MGHQVTIEGSIMPAVDLPRGERRTVEVTPYIRQLVRIGAVIVVEGSLTPPPTVTPPAPAVAEADEGDEVVDDEVDAVAAPHDAGAPHGNASKAEWTAFLNSQGIVIPTDDEGRTPPRDGLKALWQQASGGR